MNRSQQRPASVTSISILMAMLVLAPATVRAAGTPEQACQAAKNLASGKYAACRQNAEKNFVLADATKYANAILTCEAKFATAWQKAIDKATQAGATCPDAPLTGSEYKTVIDAHTDNVATFYNWTITETTIERWCAEEGFAPPIFLNAAEPNKCGHHVLARKR